MSKLHLYGAIARAFYYQVYRRSLQRRAELRSLGVISRVYAEVYEWWNA
jgi:hypothetical protein